jgi:cyclase
LSIAKRIIPLFLLKNKRLVKGTKFADLVDVGDPVSQAMIYDAQGADEVIVVDITASAEKRIIDTEVITGMITKCRLPICAGGGIKTISDAKKCFKAGADKIAVNSSAALRPILIKELADEFGSQSVVVSIDVKKDNYGGHDIYIFSGRQKIEMDINSYMEKVMKFGAGEIILTSIDREGSLSGFDYELYEGLKGLVSTPLIVSGGAGRYDDIVRLFGQIDCDAVALGKMLFLRDYDIVRIKSYLRGRKILVRDA